MANIANNMQQVMLFWKQHKVVEFGRFHFVGGIRGFLDIVSSKRCRQN